MTLVRKAGTICLLLTSLLGCDDASKNTKNGEKGNAEAESILVERNEHGAAVDALMASMSLQQKVAQMIQGEIKHVSPDDVRTYGIGSVLNGGGSFPNQDKNASLEDWVALADAYREASLDTSQGSSGIPLL